LPAFRKVAAPIHARYLTDRALFQLFDAISGLG
jgi:hypothetical protein